MVLLGEGITSRKLMSDEIKHVIVVRDLNGSPGLLYLGDDGSDAERAWGQRTAKGIRFAAWYRGGTLIAKYKADNAETLGVVETPKRGKKG
jgi:hypothetical protein